MKTRKLDRKEIFYRSHTIDKSHIDEEARTIEVAFSSETPVERYFGFEVLDHNRDAVILNRIMDGGPLLVDHDMKDHIGVVENITIDSDRKARAKVRFGRSARANEVFQDVVDGIRKSISVGYRIHETEEKTVDKIVTIFVRKWEPLEISLVSIPADISVGVGRSADETQTKEVVKMSEETKKVTTDTTKKVDVKIVRSEGVTEGVTGERDRVRRIQAIAGKFDDDSLFRDYVAEGKSPEDYIEALGDKRIADLKAKKETPATELGLTKKETQRFSLMKAIRASVSGDWSKAGFENECSLAISDALDREARGFFVPMDIQKREMSTGVPSGGGTLVGTDHLAGSFIEALRDNAVSAQAGITFLPGLVGNVDIPKQTGSATFSWLAEGADGILTDAATGTVTLSPTTVAGATAMTRRLLKQSSPSVEAMVQRDLAIGAALAIDLAVFEGSGVADQPTGIVNTSGVGTVVIAAPGTPTWPEIVAFETGVDGFNALDGSLSYVTTSAVRGTLKTSLKDAGSGMFLMDNDSTNGYTVRTSNQLTAARIIFGNYSSVILGMWGVLDLMPDTSTNAASGGLVLRAFQDLDIGIRHAESFAINTI